MKEYRLTAWPELAPPFHHTAHRRMATDMSHRYVTLAQLTEVSGLRRHAVRNFIDMLDNRGMLTERECHDSDAQFWSLRPLGGWLRRALTSSSHAARS